MYLQQFVPVNSFAPFKTGENPAMIQNKEFSQLCADLYQNIQTQDSSVACLFFSDGGDSIFQETAWINGVIQNIRQDRLGDKEYSFFVVPPKNKRSR